MRKRDGSQSSQVDQVRVGALADEQRFRISCQIDRLFAGLMVFQWVAGVAIALWISPRTWIGTTGEVHIHVWAAVLLGGVISALPIYLALRHSGQVLTRHVIGAAQVLWSALLIHLSGGRIETHFHVFGSLAFLAFYRDWRVLVTATAIVAVDHCLRGLWWPQSVFGILTASPYRWLEHAGWVAFEDVFLITSCISGSREMRNVAERQVALEQANERVERVVQQRTQELAASEERFALAVAGSSDGLWDWDLRTDSMYYSPRFKQLLGCENHELANTFEAMDARLHPEDHDAIHARLQAHLWNRAPYDVEMRLLNKDGSYRWYRVRGQAIWDADNKPMRMAGSMSDVTDRKRDERHVLEARDRAEEANRAKSEFLASMSHELRTPLNAIIGFTDGLLDRTDKHPLSDHQKDRLARVRIAGQNLLSLINDVLDIAKVEAGEMRLTTTTFDPAELAAEVGDLTEPLIAKKPGSVAFSLAIEEGLELIRSDRDRVKQILVNLLSNAVKFTKAGSISLVVQREGDRVHFSVEDTGKGIPSCELHRIFDKFHQVGDHHQEGGTGLGLALCRKFSELLGGVLNVRSVEGEGSTFTLSLPVQPDGSLHEDHETLKRDIRERAARAMVQPGSKVVICVEDDPGNMLLLQDYLTDAGHHVIPYFDASEAMVAIEAGNPDVIVLDVMMPGLDGWEMLRRLKDNPRTCDVPVILATAIVDRDLGLSLGASDYITKPIDRKRLLQSLASCASHLGSRSGEVAVVDDDPCVRDVLRDLLTDQGHTVRMFEDGAAFLDALQNWRPDAVLLDLMMPRVDGFAVVEAMRSDENWRSIPIMVLTAMILSSEQLLQLHRHVRLVIEKNGMSRDKTLQGIVEFLATLPQRRAAA